VGDPGIVWCEDKGDDGAITQKEHYVVRRLGEVLQAVLAQGDLGVRLMHPGPAVRTSEASDESTPVSVTIHPEASVVNMTATSFASPGAAWNVSVASTSSSTLKLTVAASTAGTHVNETVDTQSKAAKTRTTPPLI
jgi:hypothetical protein